MTEVQTISLDGKAREWPSAEEVVDQKIKWCRIQALENGTVIEFFVNHEPVESARDFYRSIRDEVERPSRSLIRKRIERKGSAVMLIAY